MSGSLAFDLIRARLEVDLDLAHKFVHGTDTETIVIESGEIPTLANMVKSLPLSSKLDTATNLVNSAENAVQRAEAAIAVLQLAEQRTLGYKDATLSALQTATEVMSIAQTHASNAQAAAQNVTIRADVATLAATNAASARDQASTAALSAAGYGYALSATSKTSLSIGTGSKSFSIGTGKQFVAKQWVIAVAGNNSMTGEVVSYANGNLTINAVNVTGSGTFADWTIAVSGAAGAQGPQGLQGPKGDTGSAGADGSLRKYLDKGLAAGAVAVDFALGQHQRMQVTGATTLSFANWPGNTTSNMLMLEVVNGGAFAITWPTINWVLSDGAFTQVFSANGTPLQASGTDFVMLWTRDGGATVYGKVVR